MPKKDYDKWCRGKEGVEHTVEVVLHPQRVLASLAHCHWENKKFYCVHVKHCTVCKRVLTYEWQMKPEDCPEVEDKSKIV